MKKRDPIVYGPVNSRRLGCSLGVDLTPAGRRVCNFACAYCLHPRRPGRRSTPRWPACEEVASRLREALGKAGRLDSITISGHGEPTLHLRFPDLVEAALEEARRTRPEVPVRILTNGSRAIFPEVRRALDRLDERIIKLEADPERMSGVRVPYGAILFGLALLRDVTLHSCFVEGWLSNTGEGCVEDWIELVAEIRPRSGQVHTIDRKPVQAHVWPVPASRLAGIAVRLRGRTGIDAVAPRPGGPPVAGRRSRRPRGQRLRGPGPGARPM